VKQNQSIGVLTPVVDSEFPHIHWSILEGRNYRSPYDYCSPKAKEDMEWLCDKFSKYPED
jgi:hypothetical protein